MDTATKLKNIFVRELGLEPDEITEDLSYGATPEWDSVGHMHLVTAIEEEFEITFDDTAIGELTTLLKVRAAVEDRLE
jgi:acyl carrier protein